MLTKLSVWLSKVPHYVLAVALAVTIFGPQVLADVAGTPLAGYQEYIAKAVAYATGILALAKQFNPGSAASIKSDNDIIARVLKPKSPGIAGSLLSVFALALCGSLIGATCSTQTKAIITTDVAQAVQCVSTQVVSGDMQPEAIAAACAPLAVEDVITLVEALLAGSGPVPGSDAGVVDPSLRDRLEMTQANCRKWRAEHPKRLQP